MNQKEHAMHPWEGMLPRKAPLANPYIPAQLPGPTVYEMPFGFIRGTVFRGLDLPFHGMANQYPKHQSCKIQLQQIKFYIQEICLYLDTHPEDEGMRENLRFYQKLCQKKEEEYIRLYGPIRKEDNLCDGGYSWINGPWPWEFSRYKEG